MAVQTERPVSQAELERVMHEEQGRHVRTWRPTTGGLLAIVSGYLNILMGLVALSSGYFFSPTFTTISLGLRVTVGVLFIVLGIVSIVGGSYAIRRRYWGMALTGTITSLLPTIALVPGILSLILVTLGKPEFEMREK